MQQSPGPSTGSPQAGIGIQRSLTASSQQVSTGATCMDTDQGRRIIRVYDGEESCRLRAEAGSPGSARSWLRPWSSCGRRARCCGRWAGRARVSTSVPDRGGERQAAVPWRCRADAPRRRSDLQAGLGVRAHGGVHGVHGRAPDLRRRGTLIGRVGIDRRTQQIADVLADPEYGAARCAASRQVPIDHRGAHARRRTWSSGSCRHGGRVDPFSDRDAELLTTSPRRLRSRCAPRAWRGAGGRGSRSWHEGGAARGSGDSARRSAPASTSTRS